MMVGVMLRKDLNPTLARISEVWVEKSVQRGRVVRERKSSIRRVPML